MILFIAVPSCPKELVFYVIAFHDPPLLPTRASTLPLLPRTAPPFSFYLRCPMVYHEQIFSLLNSIYIHPITGFSLAVPPRTTTLHIFPPFQFPFLHSHDAIFHNSTVLPPRISRQRHSSTCINPLWAHFLRLSRFIVKKRVGMDIKFMAANKLRENIAKVE